MHRSKFANRVIVSAWLAAVMATVDLTRSEPPKPALGHPGNVFTFGENVAVSLPRKSLQWRLVDYEGTSVGDFQLREGRIALGKLPVGFYRLEPKGTGNWVSLAVLEPLRAPTPPNSPIGVDVAMAWFYGKERMDAVANLCALAGVNWVRDRLNWAEMEPQRGTFSGPNKYDASAAAQSRAGLRVLQVIHYSPPWANSNGKRFPLDLRDAYWFFESMAKRWRDQVQAFEPWNEADIPMFGGHTGAEMASLQKAAYLGLKAGNPKMTVCLNVFALHKTNQLADLHDNEAWPYFDTYNLHHYEAFEKYPQLYADHRAVSAGRPLWVSECAVPVKWAGDENLKEPTDADLKVQAERVAKTFAWSLHEGSAATFYFLLPHYVEGQTQFGILRPDLTPRPAYVALAAAGRLLADSRPLGRVELADRTVRVFASQAWPDGRERDVLVVWTTNRESALKLTTTPLELFDHLGRRQTVAKELKLTPAPLYVILPKDAAVKMKLTPPQAPARLDGAPSPIVFQALWPENKIDLSRSAFRLPPNPGEGVKIPFYAYNFDSHEVAGRLVVESAFGCEATLPTELKLAAIERKELTLVVTPSSAAAVNPAQVRVRGDFGRMGRPVLSLRFVTDTSK